MPSSTTHQAAGLRTDPAAATPPKQYLPFIIATALVVVFTAIYAIIESARQSVSWSDIMNYFMGFYFIVYALPKFINLRGFTNTLASYDIIASRFKRYGFIYPVIELLFGAAYLSGLTMASQTLALSLNGLVALFTAVNMAGIFRALRTRKPLACGCLGDAFTLPLSKLTLGENGLMLLMALVMVITFKSMAM